MKDKRGDTMYAECPHCDVTQAGEHHTQCPNYSSAPTLNVNVIGWERCVTAYLYPEAWGAWCDRPPLRLFDQKVGQ